MIDITKEQRLIERTYDDICHIYEFKSVKDKAVTKSVKTLVYQNIKCALSQKTLNTTSQGSMNNAISYDAKLFMAPDIKVKPGSDIQVQRYEHTYNFTCAGEAFIYRSHQELLLKRKDRA